MLHCGLPVHSWQVVEAAAREGATFVDHWFIGCNASHVVCEGSSVQRYLGHTNNVVTVSASLLHFGSCKKPLYSLVIET